MKRIVIALSLVTLTALVVCFSTGLIITSSSKTIWGPYAVQEIERIAGEQSRYKEMKLNSIGIIAFFGSLAVPVFIAGYLCGQSKKDK